jgi:hypothetical protein
MKAGGLLSGPVMNASCNGQFRRVLALVVSWAACVGSSSGASIVVGTGALGGSMSDSAAVYCWGGTDWVRISPPAGEGLGAHAAVQALCDYDGQLYAGTEGGQIYAYANGTAWIRTGMNGSEIPTQATVLSLAVYEGSLYAGTRPAGLYRYDSSANRWLRVDVSLSDMLGVVALKAWTDPRTGQSRLFMGDVYHDMILSYDGQEIDKELAILAPVGSCIWDLQDFNGYLYACSYHGRIYVRLPERVPGTETMWSLATPLAREYSNAWEMETFQGNLYVGSDGTLERVVKESSPWSKLTLERVFSTPASGQGVDAIKAMVAADQLYFGTEQGRVYRYGGQKDPPVQMGSSLPAVYALHVGASPARSLKVDQLRFYVEGCVSRGGPLTYRIHYVLSGESLGQVTLVQELPVGVAGPVASPEPTGVEGRVIRWNLGQVKDKALEGSVSVTVSPMSSLVLGSEMVSTCLVLDGAVMGAVQRETLYGVDHLYVDPNSPRPAGNGSSWDTAFRTLTDAMDAAKTCGISEIWIAEGVYDLPGWIRSDGSTTLLTIPWGTSLRGGFAGHERSPEERVVGAHPTVLTRNGIAGGIIVVGAGADQDSDPQCPTQSLIEQITFRGPGAGSEVDGITATTQGVSGLTIRGCTLEQCLHGLFLEDGSGATLEDCLFRTTTFGLSASGAGASIRVDRCLFRENMCGAYLGEEASATLRRCTFAQNGSASMWDDKHAGGVIAFCDGLQVEDCHFSDNCARVGGGLCVSLPDGGSGHGVEISRCEFAGNTCVTVPVSVDDRSTGEGGGLFIGRRDFRVTDCWFVGNSGPVAAAGFGCRESCGQVVRSLFYSNQVTGSESSCGGAIGIRYQQGSVEIIRSVFADNRAPYGGGVCCAAGLDYATHLVNCTFTRNQGTYWAGGALSVSNVKVDQRTTLGAKAVVTNCLFYGNTGKADGSAMEVYAGSTLTLASSALDGAWYRAAVVWVELDKLKRPLGQLEVDEADVLPLLSSSPFMPDTAFDYHLRSPQAGETAGAVDGGRTMTLEGAAIDLDGDAVPSDGGWDIGADELDPNAEALVRVAPAQTFCDCSRKTNPDLQIVFRSARYAGDDATPCDRVSLVWMDGPSPKTVTVAPIIAGTPGVSLDTTLPQGLANGTMTFSAASLSLPSGVYTAQLLDAGKSPVIKAVSRRFFVRSIPPDPRTLVNQP